MMKKTIHICTIAILFTIICSTLLLPISANTQVENKYYFEKFVDTGKDNGYSENNEITKGNPHKGWILGRFCIDGYTQHIDKDGTPIFLKTVGDTVTLWFELEQDITKLNGDKKLSISDDKNGYDNYFDIDKTDFGRGTLIVRKTDYQNHTVTYPPYLDYLAGVKQGARTEIELCEEGDYEVALDYEIRKDNVDIFGWNPFPSYFNYQIYFKFSVRNGNCMVYPFDVKTKAELMNGAITENGFYLDFANSKNLTINIKKEIRLQGAEGLTEDTRFNKPAKDHEEFTEEGIYTITAQNEYTNQTTTKTIYVGKDDVLKAYVATGGTRSIVEIERLIAEGAKVAADGTLILASGEKIPHVENTKESELSPDNQTYTNQNDEKISRNPTKAIVLFSIVTVLIAAIITTILCVVHKKHVRFKDGEKSK